MASAVVSSPKRQVAIETGSTGSKVFERVAARSFGGKKAVSAAPPLTSLRKSLRFIASGFFKFIRRIVPAYGYEALDVVVHGLSEGSSIAGALSPKPQDFR